MDIKNFFPSVTYPRVKGVFRGAGYREQIATLLALLCTEPPRETVEHEGKPFFIAMGPRCLPQGAPTSPAITNTLCRRMDHRLAGVAKKYGWRYTRYADDLTFSLPKAHQSDPHIGSMIGLVTRIAAAEGFEIHTKKTRLARGGRRQTVTGLVVNGHGTPRVPRKIKRQVRAMIHNLRNGKSLQEGDTTETLKGLAAYVYMAEPELGSELLSAIEQLRES
jgi:hypothetical protein